MRSYIHLQGRPSRPIDDDVVPREKADFLRVSGKLPPNFFGPFQEVLNAVGMSPIEVEPDRAAIHHWNNHDFMPRVVSQIEATLDEGRKASIVPLLISTFMNLERENTPSPEDWLHITAIAIPGSRTYERTAEAFRAYIRTQGRASFITSGRAPLYDQGNAQQLSEAEASAAYLRMLGVPHLRIYTEDASRDTEENAAFLPAVLRTLERERDIPVHNLLLVTSNFHLTRYRLYIELMMEMERLNVNLYAVGAKGGRYQAETFFLTDEKFNRERSTTLGVVINEYLKIAYEVCARPGDREMKAKAQRK